MFRTRFFCALFTCVVCCMNGAGTASTTAPNTTTEDPWLERIVGGKDVPEGEYVPYQVSLQYNTSSRGYQHFCGGSIISPTRILTAAHCCDGLNARRMSIVAGIRDLKARDGQRAQVVSYEIHENYEELVTSDIAILTLSDADALQLDGMRVATVDVSSTETVGGGVPVTLTGWGLRLPAPLPFLDGGNWEHINYPNILQTMTYSTITNQQCRYSGLTDLTETELCARGLFKSACSGDSGGPLVLANRNGATAQQVGIVSYGFMICGGFGIPDAYTRVSEFAEWIRQRL